MPQSTSSSTVRFSDRLEKWLQSKQPKTLGDLNRAFGEKGLAVTILLLMIIPALPLPTGGITHVFEGFTIVLSLPLLIGRQSIWMPAFIAQYRLGKRTLSSFLPAMLKLIRKFEHISKPRGTVLMQLWPFRVICGVAIIGLALTAALAPPFSGLDTLPALGIVIITLGIILDDFLLFMIGLVAGLGGLYAVIFLGEKVVHFIHHLFRH